MAEIVDDLRIELPNYELKELINFGIVNIDKPSGPTSHHTADYVKKILNIKKAGHSGTLDPKVTGMLVIALDKATRISQLLLKSGKEYVGVMHIHKDNITEERIRDAISKYLGDILQKPPVRSAVKREERKRSIYYFRILEIEGRDILFRVGCQAGTYIRKLIHQIGSEVGGAHMAELRRTRVGPFDESTEVRLQDLKDAYIMWKESGNEEELRKIILPVESALQMTPKIWIRQSAVTSISHGRDLAIPGIARLNRFNKGDKVAILKEDNKLLAIGLALISTEDIEKNNKGAAIKIDRVFAS